MEKKFIIGLLVGLAIAIFGFIILFRNIPCVRVTAIEGNSITGAFKQSCINLNQYQEIWLFKKNAYGYFCQSQLTVSNNSWNGYVTGEKEKDIWQLIFCGFDGKHHNALIELRDRGNQVDQSKISNLNGDILCFIAFEAESVIDKVLNFLKPYESLIILFGLLQSIFSITKNILNKKKLKKA